MKNLLKFFTLSSFLLVWLSCTKENQNSLSSGSQLTTVKRDTLSAINCANVKNAIANVNGKLVFSSYQHFYDCIECLEQELEQYNTNYENQYPNATPEQLDVMDSINNFNQFFPLVQFEASKSFNSLRGLVANQSNTWLNAQAYQEPDFNQDPDMLCPIPDQITRSLFNTSGKVQIGNEEVSSADWTSPDFLDCCSFLHLSKFTFDVNNSPILKDRQIKARISIKSGIILSNLNGNITHYRKVGGTYKIRRARMRLAVGGIAMDDCNPTFQNFEDWKGWANKSHRDINAEIWGLWREAITCSESPNFRANRCILTFLVDSETNAFALVLKK